MRRSKADIIFDRINVIVVLLITVIIVYPLYFIVIASFSDPYAVSLGKVFLIPNGLSLMAYRNVFINNSIWTGYINTIMYTVGGTIYNLVLTIPAAYVLSKKFLPLRSVISWYFFLTMYFSGGLIPTFILYRNLGLYDSRWAMVLTAGVSCWYLIITRQYFTASIPDEIYQAAEIDGAGHIMSFFRIALPLSAPIVAVMALFNAVGIWNSYVSALIYLSSQELFPLQLVLRGILIQNQTTYANLVEMNATDTDAIQNAAKMMYIANAMKYALIFIASAPLLAAYPFVQKYFVKGVLVGSIKG